MNEQIFKLALKAMDFQGAIDIDTELKMTNSELAKFAELIVRECAEVAQDFVTVENNKLVEHVHISPWQLQDKIKEHFGVEE